MFARVKKSGKYQYLQIVENRKVKGKVKQHLISTIGQRGFSKDHQCDENIRGHVFCSFLALVLRKELERRLNHAGHVFEWSDIKRDLRALQTVTIEENEKRFAIRTECQGNCGKIFQAVRVVLPPTIREIA